ncbi:MAG TPA: YbjN domain-containing protein [Herpetosiphonaceae bacterium]
MGDTFDDNDEAENDDYQPQFDPDHEHANGWRAFTTLGLFLEEDNWYPQRVGDKPSFRSVFQGTNGDLLCLSQIRIEAQQLVIYAYAPVKVPADVRLAAAEYLTRANYGMFIGNFELDFNDGEVRYKTSCNFEDELLTMSLIRNHIYPAVHLMDRYLPGLMRVIYGNVSPEEAVGEIEKA